MKDKKTLLLIGVLVLFVLIQFFLINSTPVLLWDEPVYLANARGHIEKTYFEEDFRFPLLELFIAPLWLITGVSVLSAQILMVLFSIATLFIFYKITKFFIYDFWMRLILTTFFGFSKLFLFWSYRIYTDIPAIFFMLLSWYFALEYVKSPTKKMIWNIFISGVATALAFYMRFPAAISALAIVPLLLFKKDFKAFLYYLLGGLTIVLPWSIYNTFKYGNPLWDLFAQAKIIGMYTYAQPVSLFLKHVWGVFGILLFFILGFILIKKRELKSFQIRSLLILFILSLIYYAFFIGFKLERYVLSIMPFIILLIGVGTQKLINSNIFSRNNLSLILRYVFFTVVLLSICLHLILFSKAHLETVYCDSNNSLTKAVDFAKENVPEGELIISNAWTWYGFYGNHQISSTWSNNLNDIILDNDSAWIFIANRGGIEVPEGLLDSTNYVGVFTGICGDNITIYNFNR